MLLRKKNIKLSLSAYRNFSNGRILLSIFFVLLGFLFASCKTSEIPKDALVVLIEQEPKTLDPLWTTDAISQNLNNLIHTSLVQLNPDLKVIPELAKTFRHEGYKRFIFEIRENAKFHDGSLITPLDIQESIERFSHPTSKSPHSEVFRHIKRIKVEKNRIVLETDEPQPFLFYDLSLVKIHKNQNGSLVPAGRFKLVSNRAREIVLERFTDFYLPQNSNVKNLIFKVSQEDLTRFQLLKRKDANVIFNGLSITLTAHLISNLLDDIKVFQSPGVNIGYLGMNFRNQYLKDIRVRKAMAHSLDLATLLKERFQSLCYLSSGVLAPVHPGFEGNVTKYGYDPARAEKLLDEAGFLRDPKTKMRFKIEFKTTGDKSALDFAKIFQHYLAQVGIELKIRSIEFGTFFSDLRAGNFDVYTSRWVGVSNPSILFRVFHSSQMNALNRGGYKNEKVDVLLSNAMKEVDDAKRNRFFSDAQKILADDLPYLFLWHWNNALIATGNVENVYPYANGNFLTLSELRKK